MDTSVPQHEFISEILNTQVLIRDGCRIVPRPQSMDVFQADETNRSSAFVNYRQGGMKPSVAVRVLGIDLPADVKPEDLDDDVTMPVYPYQGPSNARSIDPPVTEPAVDSELIDAKNNERRQFRNYCRKGRDPNQFEFNYLDDDEQAILIPEYAPLVRKVTELIDSLKGD